MSSKEEKLRSGQNLANTLARRLGARLIETHVSWVLLTDRFAYKMKKPVKLPFLDFSTLERRRHFCRKEVQVNRALAPSLYLGVVRITGSAAAPELDGRGRTLDYAVAMKRFPDGALFSERLAEGALSAEDVDRLAGLLAAAHAEAPVLRRRSWGGGSDIHGRALAALHGAKAAFAPEQRAHLARWLKEGAARLEPDWRARRREGHVRECHGDLHLANLVMLDGRPAAFDAIEFDPALRWIDVAEDAAFPAMDFAARGRPDFCWRFLNGWLDASGEYEAAGLLRYALVYRALVRTEVACMRPAGAAEAAAYARAALDWSLPRPPRLVITHGLPGSGKTFQSQRLLERQGAIRLRSDVERKRLFGLGALQSSRAMGLDIYSGNATGLTYQRLLRLARCILLAGFDAVIDAAFLLRSERDAAHALAIECGASFGILACVAPREVLQRRLAARVGDASEADGAVLARLMASVEALGPDERALALSP